MKVYSKLLRYVSEIKKEVVIKTLLMLLVSAASIVQAILMSKTVNNVFAGTELRHIVILLIGVVVTILARSLVLRFNETYTKTMAATIKEKLRLSILNKVFQLGPGYMSEKRSGKVTSLILDGVESLEPFFVRYVPQILTVIASGGFVFFYLARYDMVSSLLLLASMSLCVIVPLITVPVMSRSVDDYWAQYSQMTSQYIDAIQGMTTLKTLNAESSMGKILYKNATDFWHRSIRNTGISLSNSALMIVLSVITSSLTVVIAAIRVQKGIVPVEAVTAFLFLAVECSKPMTELNNAWHASFLGISVARELFEMIDVEPPVQQKYHCRSAALLNSLPTIQFHDVSFSYPQREEVLHQVNFSVKPGSTTAIVGRSGAGKSTILNLILRFYDVTKGGIKINGVDLREFDLESLRGQIAVVFQDTFLFQGTVEENIRMASPEAKKEDVIKAAKAAYAHDFIDHMPEGYDTIIGERGYTLSGGERQRIAIARAFLKNAPLLLLDEATSSIDAHSEELIQRAIKQLTDHCTTLVIAHRLSTVYDADKIIVLENGKIVEQGDHGTLMKEHGVYAELIRAQKEASQ